MEYLSCSSLEHCSHYCCEEHHGCYLIYKIFIFIFFLYGIDFSCFAKIFVGWPRLFRLVWLILIPAKLHNYYENSKGKKVPFQPITACDIHYDNSCTRYMKNFSCLHYTCSFITCVCCRKKTTEVLIQGCLLYHIHQDLFNFFLTQLPSLLSKALSLEDLRTAQWKKSEVVWQKSIWTSLWWMNVITLCNALNGKKKKLKQIG